MCYATVTEEYDNARSKKKGGSGTPIGVPFLVIPVEGRNEQNVANAFCIPTILIPEL